MASKQVAISSRYDGGGRRVLDVGGSRLSLPAAQSVDIPSTEGFLVRDAGLLQTKPLSDYVASTLIRLVEYHFAGTTGESPILSGFSNFGAPHPPLKYGINRAGIVHILGVVTGGTYAAYPGSPIVQIPDLIGRPKERIIGQAVSDDLPIRADIDVDGKVYVVGGSVYAAVNLSFPAETILTIICLGDSVTHGFNTTKNYPSNLNDDLGIFTNVVDKGVNGEDTTSILNRFATDVLEWMPTYCVIGGGINDLIAAVGEDTIKSNFQSMYDDCITNNIKPIALTIEPWKNYISYSSDEEVIRLSINQWIKTYASLQDFSVIDLESILGDSGSPPALRTSYDSGDGLHPNNAGAAAIAENIHTTVEWIELSKYGY